MIVTLFYPLHLDWVKTLQYNTANTSKLLTSDIKHLTQY